MYGGWLAVQAVVKADLPIEEQRRLPVLPDRFDVGLFEMKVGYAMATFLAYAFFVAVFIAYGLAKRACLHICCMSWTDASGQYRPLRKCTSMPFKYLRSGLARGLIERLQVRQY